MWVTNFVDNIQFMREPFSGNSALGWPLCVDKQTLVDESTSAPRLDERKAALILSIPSRKVLQVGQEGKTASLRIGNVVFDAEERKLYDASGQQLFLRAQSAELLDLLILHQGNLVSRDQIIDQIWPDIAVTDDSITQCIRDIRKVIGDHKRTILATVPKRGYVLHAFPVADGNSFGFGEQQTSFASKTSDAPALNLLHPQLDPRDMMPTLAILPFKSEGGGPTRIFGAFLADEIAKLLGLAEDVNVISRLSTGTLGGSAPGLVAIKEKTNTDFVLSGYLLRHENQVAVSLEFAETESGYVLWSERLQLPFDPTAAETEGLDQIVAYIRRSIMLNEMRRVHSRELHDLKLFSVLHGAVGLMHRFSHDDFDRSKNYLEHLHHLAPRHPAPLSWMARWHVLNAVQGWAQDPKRETEAALRYTAAALDIDPENTLALVCEGQVLVHLAQDLDAAEARYDHALATNPNDANGRALRAMLRGFTDRAELGKRDVERSLHLTPLDPHRFFYLALAAGVCIANEEFDRAVALTKESLRLNRSHASTVRMLPVALLGANDLEAAHEAATSLMQQQPSLRVNEWLRSSPSADFRVGRKFADMLSELGVPE